jgi:transposase InsO family protein|tara:strand:- start:10660 stop:10926 length:267 start_codon:yes stop_codon:yes gene_type:complete
VIHVRQRLDTSERRTCNTIGLGRSSLRYQSLPKDDDELRLALIRLAKQYGRYGYRKIAQLLRIEGWTGATVLNVTGLKSLLETPIKSD